MEKETFQQIFTLKSKLRVETDKILDCIINGVAYL